MSNNRSGQVGTSSKNLRANTGITTPVNSHFREINALYEPRRTVCFVSTSAILIHRLCLVLQCKSTYIVVSEYYQQNDRYTVVTSVGKSTNPSSIQNLSPLVLPILQCIQVYRTLIQSNAAALKFSAQNLVRGGAVAAIHTIELTPILTV